MIKKLILISLFVLVISCTESNNDSEDLFNSSPINLAIYPEISIFETTPSDRFLVDIDTLVDGHMYKGANSDEPHTGAHVIFDVSAYPTASVTGYPKIYAIADGQITNVDTYFLVNNPTTPHYRYGIDLTFASRGSEAVAMHYSIEPFVDPGDEDFYKPFILVNVGDSIKKGDVIAHMYLENNANAHIHFNLYRIYSSGSSDFQAPTIFSSAIMTNFLNKITTGTRNYDTNQFSGSWMGDCMGYKISDSENPFEETAIDCLK
jgi:hypothetical protein